jgi:hypothetical protein
VFFHFAGLYPALMASASNMYLPCFVFPYQRDPRLWYTLVSVLIHTKPAAFAGSMCGFAEDAGAVAAGGVEGEAEGVEVGFAELGAAAGVTLARGLSALPVSGDCARSVETLTLPIVTTSTKATRRARASFFGSRFIVVGRMGFGFALKCVPAGSPGIPA